MTSLIVTPGLCARFLKQLLPAFEAGSAGPERNECEHADLRCRPHPVRYIEGEAEAGQPAEEDIEQPGEEAADGRQQGPEWFEHTRQPVHDRFEKRREMARQPGLDRFGEEGEERSEPQERDDQTHDRCQSCYESGSSRVCSALEIACF